MQGSPRGSESQPNDEPVPVGEAAKALVERAQTIARNAPKYPENPAPDWRSGEGRYFLDSTLRRAGVPERYRDAALDRVRPRAAVEEYLGALRENVAAGRGLLLSGPVGTGKSSVAAIVCTECVKADISIHWSYVADLIDLMADPRARAEVMRKQVGPDVLVWDDLAVGGLYDWQVGLLDRVVENRYRRRKAMIVTTNLTPTALRADAALDRFVDRWRQMSPLIRCEGESMRIQEDEHNS